MIPATASQPARPLLIFCDFDGTFSVQDVGSTLAQKYMGERRAELWARYERGELRPWEYSVELLDGFAIPVDELNDFLATIDLDPGARRMLAWCAERGVPFLVLSDGYDFNLDRLQIINDVAFDYVANHLDCEDGVWRIAPGHPDSDCACGTGTCKASIIEEARRKTPDSYCIHIGNGRVSDLCGAITADLAFAKDTLAPALDARGESYETFATLFDVIEKLEVLLEASAASGN